MTIEEIRASVKWWEYKRWIFNVVVGIAGVVGIVLRIIAQHYWSLGSIIIIVLWGVFANVFYSLGFLFEIFNWFYLKNRLKLKRNRRTYFVLGVSFSFLLTLYCSWLLFIITNINRF